MRSEGSRGGEEEEEEEGGDKRRRKTGRGGSKTGSGRLELGGGETHGNKNYLCSKNCCRKKTL